MIRAVCSLGLPIAPPPDVRTYQVARQPVHLKVLEPPRTLTLPVMEHRLYHQAPPSPTHLSSEEVFTETPQRSSLWLELTPPQHDSSVHLPVDGNSVGWYQHNSFCHIADVSRIHSEH